MDRYDYERSVESSSLPTPARAVALALARRVNRELGAIPVHAQPSISRLAALTGHGKSTVKRALRRLEAGGWIERHRPTPEAARERHETTAYTLTIPPHDPQARPAVGQAHGPARATPRPAGGRDPSPGRAETLARGGPEETEHTEGTEIGQANGDDLFARIALEELAARGRRVTPAEAAEAARQVLAGRSPRSPAAYLRSALRAEPDIYRWCARRPRGDARTLAESQAFARGGGAVNPDVARLEAERLRPSPPDPRWTDDLTRVLDLITAACRAHDLGRPAGRRDFPLPGRNDHHGRTTR